MDESANHYLTPYHQWASEHGPGFGVTLWANRDSQFRRFRVFSELVYFQDKRVLDAGASRGDLAAWLLEQGLAYAQYTGIDGLPEAIDFAKTRQLPRASFTCGDFLANPQLLRTDNPQIICLSGTLNTMTDQQAFTLLANAWDATEQTLIFNFLADTCHRDAPLQDHFARRLPTFKLLDWAMQQTWQVVFRQDYFDLGHDATIVMQKPS